MSMKIEEIQNEYDIDCKMNSEAGLDNSAMQIPALHNKYIKMRSSESKALHELRVVYEQKIAHKTLHLTGKLTAEEYSVEPLGCKIAKVELPTYLSMDAELNKLKLYIEIQNDKVKMLDEIIRAINNRTYLIGHIIKWKMFEAGLNG